MQSRCVWAFALSLSWTSLSPAQALLSGNQFLTPQLQAMQQDSSASSAGSSSSAFVFSSALTVLKQS